MRHKFTKLAGGARKGHVPTLTNTLEASGGYTYNFNTKNSTFSPQVVPYKSHNK